MTDDKSTVVMTSQAVVMTKDVRVIGLDPGTHTGYAHATNGKLVLCQEMPIHVAMLRVRQQHEGHPDGLLVRFEDAHKRGWLGAKGREALQGAGSIKRDCTIWRDFLTDLGVPFEAVAPSPGNTKWSADTFAKAFDWPARTNEHCRDAGVLAMLPVPTVRMRIEAFLSQRSKAAA